MTYPGGKAGAGVTQLIINQQPPHSEYIEAFLGGGAIMRAKRPASTNVGIDVDGSATHHFLFKYRRPEVQLYSCDAIAYLQKRREWSGTELIYCDPPYIMSTRRSQRQIYLYELDDASHSQLLAVLQGLPCMVQISGYWSELYAEALKDWRLVRFQTTTRGHGVAEECLWMNYPEPTALHDYRFLGSDYRERERIRRKIRRHVDTVNSLPHLEKLAMLEALAGIGSFNVDAGRIAAIDDKRRPIPAETAVA